VNEEKSSGDYNSSKAASSGRGNAVRAFLRDRELPWASISKRGTHFPQRLPNARRHLLGPARGTRFLNG